MRTIIALMLLLAVPIAVSADEAVKLKTREGVTVRVAIVAPSAPKGVAILFAGGAGKLRIKRDGTIKRGTNFLVRSRALFAVNGFVALVPDTSSDRKKGDGLRGFRDVIEYLEDLKALVAYARKTYNLPIWLVGTSAGTISVAHGAEKLKGALRPDGLVFSASITEDSSHGAHVLNFDIDDYTGPVLISHHQRDDCSVTPPDGVDDIKDKLTKASAVGVQLYDGGEAAGQECKAKHYHGFNGIEDKVVGDMTKWMLAHQ